MNFTLRAAQLFDAEFAAPLIQQTIGAIGLALTGTTNDTDAAHVIAEFFKQRGNRLSFTNVMIAELGGRPVGLAVLYAGELSQALDDPFREHLKLLGRTTQISSEGRTGELYLDTLALISDVRGQGLGGKMLAACAQKAAAQGLVLALLVEEGNPARRLYERSGFSPVGHEELAGHHYTRMHCLTNPAPAPLGQ